MSKATYNPTHTPSGRPLDDGFNPHGSGPDPIGMRSISLSYEEGVQLSQRNPGSVVEWTMKSVSGDIEVSSITVPRSLR